MRERLQEFLDHMEMVTSKELSDNEREAVFNDFMKQIQFFQNERLIHLIVTVTLLQFLQLWQIMFSKVYVCLYFCLQYTFFFYFT